MIDMIDAMNAKSSVKKITAVVLFSAIIVVFVFWGMFTRQGQGGGIGSAAQVNKSIISVADLQSETQRMEQMYSFLGGMGDNNLLRQRIRAEALNNLVRNELVSQTAQSEGILSTDSEVRDVITKDIQPFQKDGRFQREIYQQYLDGTRTNAADFEERVRKNNENMRVRHLFEISFQPTNVELSKTQSLKNQQINISFLKIDRDALANQKNISSDAVAKALSQDEFMKRVENDFNTNKAQYAQQAGIRAQHILVKVDPKDPTSEKKALEKIQDIAAKAKKEDFGALAEKYSDDPGSKTKKGDLGFFARGRMVPEFEQAAFALKPGEISEPVKTNYGYHLIKVTEKHEAKEATLADHKNEIAKKLLAQEMVDQDLKNLEEALNKGNNEAVQVEAKKLNLSWQETGFFSQDSETVPKLESPMLASAVWEVSQQKPVLNKLVRDGNFRYVIKLKEQKNETPKEDKSEKTMLAQISRERANDAFEGWVNQAAKTASIRKNTQLIQVEQE